LKTYPVRELSRDEGGEYVLGLKDLGTHACYLIYGELAPGEEGRKICPGEGHEEILLAVVGDIEVRGDEFSGRLPAGEAMHFRGEETCAIGNPGGSTAIYVLAGGHSETGHK
jgi:uncharacterized cupin superfamily protein